MSGRQDLRVGSLCSLRVGRTFIKVTDLLSGPGALPVLIDKEVFKAPTAPLKRFSARRTIGHPSPNALGSGRPAPSLRKSRLPARPPPSQSRHQSWPRGWPGLDPGGVTPGVEALGLKCLSSRHHLPGRREPQSFAFHV